MITSTQAAALIALIEALPHWHVFSEGDRRCPGMEESKDGQWVAHHEVVQAIKDAASPETFECTGVAAMWCPVHGDCKCRGGVAASDKGCPLHSATSTHAESAKAGE